MTLALIAPSFSIVSETFIADHVRTLAPGDTVLVCSDSTGAETYGCPVLSHVAPRFTGFSPADRWVKDLYQRLSRRFGPPLSFTDRMRVIEFFKTHDVDRVLAEFGNSGTQVADICSQMGIPLYVYFRGADASSAMRFRKVRRRYQNMFGKATGIFCVSRHIAEKLIALGCSPEILHVNPSGAVIEAFPPCEPVPGRMIAVGRLVEKKAPHLTIEAFGRIVDRFPEARLELVGDGPLAERCRQTIERLGIGSRVSMHGALNHAATARLMRRAGIFVQHSRVAPDGDTEGFPTAIAEAMSTALAVISTRHAGIGEHVREGETGLLVDEGDVAGMAESMSRLLADPGYQRRLGAAARAHAIRHLDRTDARRRVRQVLGLIDPEPQPETAPTLPASREVFAVDTGRRIALSRP